MANEWIKYKEKVVLDDNNTVLCVLHLDGALVFGRADTNELDVKYFNLSHKDKLEKCYDIALSRANDAFLQSVKTANKESLHEQIRCHVLYLNYLSNSLINYTESIIKTL